MSLGNEPADEFSAVKSALITFASTLDIGDLPDDEAFERLYETDTSFRIWYNEAPELEPMRVALRSLVRNATDNGTNP